MGAALILAVPAGALSPTAPVVSQLYLPVEGTTTSLFGDTIDWSGTIHLTLVIFPDEPIAPSDPYRVYSNVVNLVGLGDSGLTYRAFGAETFTSPTVELTQAFTLSYPHPHRGLAN